MLFAASQINIFSMHHLPVDTYDLFFLCLFFKEILFSINKFLYEWFCTEFSRLSIFCSPGSHYSMESAQEKNP